MINKLRADMKESMIQKDTVRRDTLKMVISRATLDAKEKKIDVTNEVVMAAITKEIKQLDQTITILIERQKEDTYLYTSSVKQKEILMAYMPKQLTEEEIRAEISRIIETTEDKKMIMKNIMTELKGKADGALINRIAKEMM